MYTGIALYGTEDVAPKAALDIGKLYFEKIEFPISIVGCYRYLLKGDHKGDHFIEEISLDKFNNEIKNEDISSFRLYYQNKKIKPWVASFGYLTNKFSGFPHLEFQFPSKDSKVLLELLKELISLVKFDYGIVYFCETVTRAFYYATGDNMVSLYPYEDSFLFNKETSGRFNGKESYRTNKLRMVYPYNLLTQNHLNIEIDNSKLVDFIINNNYGSLKESNNIWIWEVEPAKLDEINIKLGKAGLLVSWKDPSKQMERRKLP